MGNHDKPAARRLTENDAALFLLAVIRVRLEHGQSVGEDSACFYKGHAMLAQVCRGFACNPLEPIRQSSLPEGS